jgi:histone H3/H4
MTYLTNPNFADNIIRSAGGEGRFDSAEIPALNLLVEFEMRHLLETAIKFMGKDRRDTVVLGDIVSAAKELGHGDVCPDSNFHQNSESACLPSRPFKSEDFLKEELQELEGLSLAAPRLEGRWIFIKGKIPTLNENVGLKSLTQMASREQEGEERKKFVNVIKDDPYSLLSKEQIDYFDKMCVAISDNINPQGSFTVEGDLNNLLPFFLKFLGEGELNDTGACFLLKLIDNKYIWLGIEYYLKKILSLLLLYRGEQSFQVGAKIAQLVDRFSDKYPMLRDIFINYQDDSYSTILKKIPFELQLGIALEVDERILQRCKNDSERGDKMAILCMEALLSYSSQLKLFREFLMKKMNTYVYWHPCA